MFSPPSFMDISRTAPIVQRAENPFARTTPDLAANQICRIIFAILGTILCWVPLRLLSRNGEFVAVVFIIDVVIMNLFTILNASIWPNDNWDEWWDGIGYCDIQVYLALPMQCLYAACIFAIMRNLAQRLRLKRVNNLTQPERRRRNLIQCLIIFPVPLCQIALIWFLLSNRYIIGAVVGCFGMFDQSWFKIVVLIFPPALFAIATIPYAFLTWKRFRDISKTTKTALIANTKASLRAQRTRRRLYQMSLSIILPYVPLQMVFFAINLKETLPDLKPYDYYAIHFVPDPSPWSEIVMMPSWMLDFATMNQPWVAILTTIPIVLFFGMTNEAIETYRSFLSRLGFAKCYPSLKEPYDPDCPRSADSSRRSWWNLSKNKKATANKTTNYQASTVYQSGLPNSHHQTIITSEGPFIPPRHSSTSQRGPVIPPRHSSLKRGRLLRNSPLQYIPIKMPSLSTLRSGKKKRSKENSSSSIGVRTRASEESIPLQSLRAQTSPRTPTSFPPLNAPPSNGQEVVPRDMFFSKSSSSNPGSVWALEGNSSSRPAPHHHAERSRLMEEQETFEDAGNGFVRVKITGGQK